MKFQNVGYIRVSSLDQNFSRQLDGLEIDRVFEEKQSGKNIKDRPVLFECLKYIRHGDTLHVHSMDRLARNLKDLLALVEEINNKGVSVVFHKESMTFHPDNKDAFATLMLSVIGACAEFERAIIKERQREGISIALKKGIRFGAEKKLSAAQISEIKTRIGERESLSALAREFNVSRQTIYRALK
jgi:DNA invertase Pin-like site-specific DNA recombinase